MRIAVVGTGYVGLVTGACLADFGNEVRCVDVDRSKIEMLERGEIPFFEPGLEDLVARNVRDRRLRFGLSLGEATRWAEVIFITVGTPQTKSGRADLSPLFAAAKTIAKALPGYRLVVQKSTAPVGTARPRARDHPPAREARRPVRRRVEPRVPARGSSVETFMRPDRVVIGAESQRAEDLLREIHEPLFLIETPMVTTSVETAELIKYAANAFLATKISFINEMANLARPSAPTCRRGEGDRHGSPHRTQVPARRAPATADRASPRTRWRCAIRAAGRRPMRIVERRHRGQRARR